jgi:hypothetical protein
MWWLGLIGAFLAFMAAIGAVYALDDLAARRYGYRPFAPPNLAFMLIPHGILLAWLAALAPSAAQTALAELPVALLWGGTVLGLLAVGFMALVLSVRTRPWIAALATCAMLAAASVLLFSFVFRDFARTPSGGPS